jgi:replicative DNA helicase Mcm
MVIDANLPPDNPEENFETFLRNFEDEGRFKYREMVQEASNKRENVLYILFEDVLYYDPPLADLLRNEPEVALGYAVDSFKDLLRFYSGGTIDETRNYFVRVNTKNQSNEVPLRGLRSVNIDKLVYIHGILIRASQIIPQITIATFECPLCQTRMELEQIENTLNPPKICANPACKNKTGFTVISKDSEFLDWQSITIQEPPEELRPGRVPYSIKGILTNDLVDRARPGDRVRITGVYKTYPNENKRGKLTTLFTPYIKVLSIEGRTSDEEELDLSPEEIAEIQKWSTTPDIQKIIARSIAPNIMGMDHLKMAAAMALFGGVRKEGKDGSARRGDIHVLYVGDPGTGKSQILKMCAIVAPQPIYTSGKGSTAAGLTAAVVRESESGSLSLEAGALVLADGGNAMIDEFDKMDNRDRVAIHEAMEQQTVSVAKAGIIATLRARTSIIAAANPKLGRYSDYKTPSDNINLSPPILSRFDLIFIVRDVPDETHDKKIADFILNLHLDNAGDEADEKLNPFIPIPLLKKYIKYARSNVFPKLSPEAVEIIRDFYVSLRKQNKDDENAAVAIVARNLEGFIRMSEAYAKMALKPFVDKTDVDEALKLAKRSLEEISIDPKTGKLDADRVLTGIPSARKKIVLLLDELKKKIEANNSKPINENDFIADMEYKLELDTEKVLQMLKDLRNEGSIFNPKEGEINIASSKRSSK